MDGYSLTHNVCNNAQIFSRMFVHIFFVKHIDIARNVCYHIISKGHKHKRNKLGGMNMKLWKLTNNAYSLILASDGRYITDSEINVDTVNLSDIEDTSSWMEGDVEQILAENEIIDEIETEE